MLIFSKSIVADTDEVDAAADVLVSVETIAENNHPPVESTYDDQEQGISNNNLEEDYFNHFYNCLRCSCFLWVIYLNQRQVKLLIT